MADEPLLYKSYIIHLLSYRRDGEWVPLAIASRPNQNKDEGHLVDGAVSQALRTRDDADAVAKKLAIEWIDAQFPSAAD